jgi:hypothetical protein
LFVPLGLYCLAWTLIYVSRAEYPSAVVALGFAAFTLCLIAMLLLAGVRRVAPRIASEADGLLARPDLRIDVLLMVANLGAFAAMATYAICAPLDMVVIAVPRDDEKYFVIACAIGIPIGLVTLAQLIRRGGSSYIRVSIDGLELGNTVTTVARTWDHVTNIADRGEKARRSTGATYVTTTDGHTRAVPTDWYTPRGCAIRELMRFYWLHPDARHELAEGLAVARLDELRGS